MVVELAVAVTTGSGLTKTVEVEELLQPWLEVVVSVYVVVAAGDAVVVAVVVEERPAAGDQE